MARALRLLVVEDVEDDALLLMRELRRGGFEPNFTRVETSRELAAALDDGRWDAIFADYTLPAFTGFDALRMMQARGIDLPFILVSGVIGEELAVEAMRAGAHDFILKGNYARLLPALERELREAAVRRERRLAEEELAKYREHLETLVAERTRALERQLAERKRAETALRESEERLKLFFEHAPAALAMFDNEMRYLAVSQRWLDDYGLGERDLLGRSHYEIFPEIDEAWKAIHRRGLAGEVICATEDRFARADGSVQWLRWEVRPWYGGDGEVGGIVIISEDVTARKEAEDAILKLNEELENRVRERTAQLEAVNRELEAFSYSVSHDLKAPLRGIDGYSRLLEEDYREQLDAEGRRFLRAIRQGAAQMHQLIEDLLAYSRMERRTLQSLPLDLPVLVRAVVAESAPEMEQYGVHLRLELPPLRVYADRDGLAVVLRNLLENAIKFSRSAQQPTIDIGARAAEDKVLLWVRDNGIGFAMQYHERIFEMFQRLQRAEDYPGTGIGLALVRKAMQRMGGRVWAESAPGAGATFFLELPEELPP